MAAALPGAGQDDPSSVMMPSSSQQQRGEEGAGFSLKCIKDKRVPIGVTVAVAVLLIVIIALAAKRCPPCPSCPPPITPSCLRQWVGYGEKCFYFAETPADWNRSQILCLSSGAHLATVDSLEELVKETPPPPGAAASGACWEVDVGIAPQREEVQLPPCFSLYPLAELPPALRGSPTLLDRAPAGRHRPLEVVQRVSLQQHVRYPGHGAVCLPQRGRDQQRLVLPAEIFHLQPPAEAPEQKRFRVPAESSLLAEMIPAPAAVNPVQDPEEPPDLQDPTLLRQLHRQDLRRFPAPEGSLGAARPLPPERNTRQDRGADPSGAQQHPAPPRPCNRHPYRL